jgi:hypothetical protein
MRRIPESRVFSKSSIHCVNVVLFPLLMFHLNEPVNNMWRNGKAREDFLHISVFHEHVYVEHCMMTACTHFIHSVCKIYTQGTVPCV